MPYAAGVYTLPPGTAATTLTPIDSSDYNAFIADIEAAQNTPRPVVAGGTGASTKAAATTGLEAVSYGAAQTLTAAQQAQARTNVSSALKGQLYGLTLSNNGSDATNDIDIAAGEAASTETNPVLMVLASALTKRLDASWAVGTNQGGLDTGSIANTTYHVWLIQRSDTGVVDALFSASASAPTMPANYDRKRRIGSILRESAAIVGFVQDGDIFTRKAPVGDVASAGTGTSAVTRTLSVPTGVRVKAFGSVAYSGFGTAASGSYIEYLSDLNQTDAAPDTSNYLTLYMQLTTGTSMRLATRYEVFTNTSAQIRSRALLSDANNTLRIHTHGWIDTRGRI